MANNFITEDELNQFRHISFKKKVDSMEAYLIGMNGCKYNMQEVGERVFGGTNYSYTVSLIHRCYNFTGQNGAKYRNGCKFEQTYGYRVTRKDIEAFVKKYPNGTFEIGINFEDFLRTRVNNAKKQNSQMRSQPASNISISQNSMTNNFSTEGEFADGKMRVYGFYMGLIGIVVLMILLFTGNLIKHWFISLMGVVAVYGGYIVVSDKM